MHSKFWKVTINFAWFKTVTYQLGLDRRNKHIVKEKEKAALSWETEGYESTDCKNVLEEQVL